MMRMLDAHLFSRERVVPLTQAAPGDPPAGLRRSSRREIIQADADAAASTQPLTGPPPTYLDT